MQYSIAIFVDAEFSRLLESVTPYNTIPVETILYVDHQHTIFTEETKTISWKGTGTNCNNYHIRATTCDGMPIMGDNWRESKTDPNTIAIPSKQLYRARDNDSLVLLNMQGTDGEARVCQQTAQLMEIPSEGNNQILYFGDPS